MEFLAEASAISELVEVVMDGAANLYKTTKYIYSLSKTDFYNCDIKDVFKVALNNILDTGSLRAMNLTMDDEDSSPLSTPEYNRVFSLIAYSFAVRLPSLKEWNVNGQRLTDVQIKAIYDGVMAKGVQNHGNAIGESFEQNRNLLRRERDLPAYTAQWYKSYLYSQVPGLVEVSNRNMFFLGTMDVLFVMFYLCLEKELEKVLLAQLAPSGSR